MRRRTRRRIEGGYPLAAIVLLVTTIAALLACIDMPRIRSELEVLTWSTLHVVGLAVMAMVGAVLGGLFDLMRPSRFRGLPVGALVGIPAAVIVVALTLAPASLWRCLAAMGLLLVTSIAVRWNAQ